MDMMFYITCRKNLVQQKKFIMGAPGWYQTAVWLRNPSMRVFSVESRLEGCCCCCCFRNIQSVFLFTCVSSCSEQSVLVYCRLVSGVEVHLAWQAGGWGWGKSLKGLALARPPPFIPVPRKVGFIREPPFTEEETEALGGQISCFMSCPALEIFQSRTVWLQRPSYQG